MISSAPRRAASGFTLLELLVVVGLISAFALVVIGALGSGRGSALQAAQGTVANLLVAARTKATAANQSARVLVNFNPSNTDQPSRYLRYLVLQVRNPDGSWRSLTDVYLPDGVFLLPGMNPLPAGLVANPGAWTRPGDDQVLRSSAFRTSVSDPAGSSAGSETWLAFEVTGDGMPNNSNGDVVLALGSAKPPGTFAAGEPPVLVNSPEQVRGMSVSSYGVATLVSDRTGF